MIARQFDPTVDAGLAKLSVGYAWLARRIGSPRRNALYFCIGLLSCGSRWRPRWMRWPTTTGLSSARGNWRPCWRSSSSTTIGPGRIRGSVSADGDHAALPDSDLVEVERLPRRACEPTPCQASPRSSFPQGHAMRQA